VTVAERSLWRSAGERWSALRPGLLGAAQLGVGVAEMFGDGRVVAGQVDRLLELLGRLAVFALLIIDPVQTVDIKPVFRLDRERAFDQPLSLVEVGAGRGEGNSPQQLRVAQAYFFVRINY